MSCCWDHQACGPPAPLRHRFTTTLSSHPLYGGHVPIPTGSCHTMEEEYEALLSNNTWELVSRPSGTNVVTEMWIFKHKFKTDGSLEQYKAHSVIWGFTQHLGISSRGAQGLGFPFPCCQPSPYPATGSSFSIASAGRQSSPLHGDPAARQASCRQPDVADQPPSSLPMCAPTGPCSSLFPCRVGWNSSPSPNLGVPLRSTASPVSCVLS
jgi:hypothetical protein